MKEIILNGVSLAELKAMRDKVAPAATKFVAENIEEGTRIVKQIRSCISDFEVDPTEEDKASLIEMVKAAKEHLDDASLVAGISGIKYDIDWYDDKLSYVNYDFEDIDLHDPAINELVEILENMEYEVEGWNSSRC